MNDPKIGDIIGCSDGDIGIVLKTYLDDYEKQLMIEVRWNSRPHLNMTDPWDSEDFNTSEDLFHVMSRA